MAMGPRQLSEILLKKFPELTPEFDKYVSWQDGMNTGSFLTYENVFRPRLESAIELADDGFLRRAGAFTEDLLTLMTRMPSTWSMSEFSRG